MIEANYKIEDEWIEVQEPLVDYESTDALNELTYSIIGACFEVHNELGKGFLEAVYKDALQYEFKQKELSFDRERKFEIEYKGVVLPHYYCADFIVEHQVILEVKAQKESIEPNVKQLINYLAVSKCPVGLLINFGEQSLKYKRVVLTK